MINFVLGKALLSLLFYTNNPYFFTTISKILSLPFPYFFVEGHLKACDHFLLKSFEKPYYPYFFTPIIPTFSLLFPKFYPYLFPTFLLKGTWKPVIIFFLNHLKNRIKLCFHYKSVHYSWKLHGKVNYLIRTGVFLMWVIINTPPIILDS